MFSCRSTRLTKTGLHFWHKRRSCDRQIKVAEVRMTKAATDGLPGSSSSRVNVRRSSMSGKGQARWTSKDKKALALEIEEDQKKKEAREAPRRANKHERSSRS